MRILHIDTGLAMRGGQAQLMMLVRGLRDKGHEQTIACPPQSQLAKAAATEAFTTIDISRGYWDASRTIRQFLKANPSDIAAAHDSRAQTISYLATAGTRIERIADRLVAFDPRNRFIHRLKYTYTCDIVIASSQAAKDTMVRNGVPAGHIEVVRGGIDVPAELPNRADARVRMRTQWKLDANDFVIGHLAAFTREKGQLDALDALIALLPRHPQLRMVLAGDGPLRNDPKTKSRVSATHGAAQLPGYIQPDAEFYAGLDLFLANSTSEALGLAPLYAMAHEVPVIASNVGGLPEVVGDCGWLVPPSDPAALAAAIERAMLDPLFLREKGLEARQQAQGFPVSVTINRTEAIYRRISGRGNTGSLA